MWHQNRNAVSSKKKFLHLIFSSSTFSSNRRWVYVLALEWKERAFIEKMNSRWFCWFPAAIFVYLACESIRFSFALRRWGRFAKTVSSSRNVPSGLERRRNGCFHRLLCTKTVHKYGVSIQSSTKGAWNVSANNSETVGHEDLRLLPLDFFQFIFWRRVYYVTVETINPFVHNVWSGAGESTAGRAPPAIAVNKLPPVQTFICSFSLWFS